MAQPKQEFETSKKKLEALVAKVKSELQTIKVDAATPKVAD